MPSLPANASIIYNALPFDGAVDILRLCYIRTNEDITINVLLVRGNKVKSQPFGRGYQVSEIVILEDDGDILCSTHKKSSSRKTIGFLINNFLVCSPHFFCF